MSDAFCPSCGQPVMAGSRFCSGCGRALGPPAPAVATAPEPPRSRGAPVPEEEVAVLKPMIVRTLFECVICVFTLGLAWVLLKIARMGRSG